jgi:hypothetical protein
MVCGIEDDNPNIIFPFFGRFGPCVGRIINVPEKAPGDEESQEHQFKVPS